MWFFPVAVILVCMVLSCLIGFLTYRSILSKCDISSNLLFSRVYYTFPRALSFSVNFLNPWIFTFVISVLCVIAALITHNTGSMVPASIYGFIIGFYGLYRLFGCFARANKSMDIDDVIVSRARMIHVIHALIILLSVPAVYLVYIL